MHIPTTIGAAALAELDRVRWRSLAHAYSGSKVDFSRYLVPMDNVEAILRAFAATDDLEMRMEAYSGALTTICHQGSLFEVTAFAVPFLAAFAADPAFVGRAHALAALVVIGAAAREPESLKYYAEEVCAALDASRALLESGAEEGDTSERAALRALVDSDPSVLVASWEELVGALEGHAERELG
jgi:hypothetical protein